MKSRAWILPLPEWDPSSLPGYPEAKAAVERGESLFPKRVPGPAPRKRPVAELEAERDRLAIEREGIDPTSGVSDTAAGRLSTSTIRAHYKATDSQLARYAALTRRIDSLNFRIAKGTTS